ncbi:family 10 glycosylhydrolase [Candidatus Sumerlaeota bacterium]|nr:family 10 glycosylhydrolase [Candidatus Sumerlaeota bacterium]
MKKRMFSWALALSAGLMSAQMAPAQNEMRAVYAATFDINTQAKCDAIINNVLTNGNINAVFVEVRGRADSYYYPNREDSTYPNNEPRGELYAISPSDLDVLQYFIDRLHTATPRVEVHAWMTTFNSWNRSTPPASPNHIFNAHPDWLTEDEDNVTYNDPVNDDAPIDPGIPAVQQHIYNVFMDVVRNYDVDGVHFDYVRLINSDAGYDPVSLARFTAETGFSYNPDSSQQALDEVYEAWRRDQISRIVQSVTKQTRLEKPNVRTSAFLVNFDDSVEVLAQGYNWWVAHDAIDFLAPGCYASTVSATVADYDFFISKLSQNGDQNAVRLYPAIGSYLLTTSADHNSVVTTLRSNARPAEGFVFFDYGSLYVDGTPADDYADALFTAGGPMASFVDVPDYPYITGNDQTAPNAPTGLNVTIGGDGTPTITFNRPTAAGDGDLPVHYRLYRDTQTPVRRYYSNMVMEWWDPASPRTSFSVNDTTANGSVYYAAVAYDDWENEAFTTTSGPHAAADGEIVVRSVSAANTVNPVGYSENNGALFTFSTAKSTADTGAPVAQTRFSSNAALTASYTITPTIPTAGNYNIYVTTPSAASVNAANSTYSIVHNGPTINGTFALTAANTGNTWRLLASNVAMSAGTGNTVTFSEASPQGDRFYADAVRFLPVRTAPTKESKPAVVPPADPTPPLSIIIDSTPQALDYDDDGASGGWATSTLAGYYNANARFYSNSNTFPMTRYAVYLVDLPVAGEWQIDGWVRNNIDLAQTVQYRIVNSSGTVVNTVASQRTGVNSPTTGAWFINVDGQPNGTGIMLPKGHNYITIYGNTGGAQTVIADALRFTLLNVSRVENWELY